MYAFPNMNLIVYDSVVVCIFLLQVLLIHGGCVKSLLWKTFFFDAPTGDQVVVYLCSCESARCLEISDGSE